MSLQTRITAIMFKTFHPVKICCFITTDAPRSDRVSSTVLWVVKHSIKLYLFILFSLTNALPSESYTSKLDFPVYNTLPSHPALSVCCFAYLCLFLIAASLRCDIHLQLHVLGEGKFNFCRNENTLMRVRNKFSLDLWERNQTQTLGWLNASAP